MLRIIRRAAKDTYRGLTHFLWVCCLGIGVFWGCSGSATTTNDPPNVLIILADDLGFYDVGYHGSEFYETPHIDSLAKEAVQFTQAYANAPVCSPSRASILTGQFPLRHGITDWIGAKTQEAWRDEGRHTALLPATNKEVLDSAHTTLAEALQKAGYSTFMAGKWHIGSQENESAPENHGFDINMGGWEAGSPRGGYFDPYQNPKLPNRQAGEALSMRLARETVAFMKQQKEAKTPFFAFLSFYAVHGPLQSTQQAWRKYRDKAEDAGIAASGFEMGRYLPVRQVQDHPIYAGMVEMMDAAVGHVLQQIKAMDLDQNTVIIFTSDNGGVSSGDQYATSNLPLKAGKGSTHEGGIRVPFLIKAPMLSTSKSKIDEPITGADIYPTVLSITKQALLPEQHKDGQNLLPLFEGKEIAERSLIWHYPHYSNQDGRPSAAIRKGPWKLIRDFQTGQKELFRLDEDLSEQTNIIELHPDTAALLTEELEHYLNESNALLPREDPLHDAKKEAQWLLFSRTKRMQSLERARLNFLSKDFNPENAWWGSEIVD